MREDIALTLNAMEAVVREREDKHSQVFLAPETVLKLIAVVRSAVDTDVFDRHSDNCRVAYRLCTCGREELMASLESLLEII